MEKSGEWVQKNLMNELKQGRELAKQLQIHLNATSSSHETREFLVHKILTSYDKALAMLGGAGVHVAGEPPQFAGMAVGMLESPRSLSGSPHSDDSDRDFKDQENKDGSKKRKSMPRWTKQVQVCQGTGLEGPLDDGFNWRKYGQKDILGAKYPRGYYRCTHRNAQGCLATKQVQRSDEDPTIFEITYRGRHTCTQGSHLTPPGTQADQPILTTDFHPQLIHQPQQSNDNILLSFQTGLKVLTEDSHNRDNTFPSFHFPSTSNTQPEKDNYGFFPSVVENNFPGNFLPSFVSPAASGSNYFSVSPTQMGGYGGTLNLQTSESEPTEIISAPTSSHSDSPTVGLDFPFGQVEFGSNFTFDNPGFFS